MDAEIKYTERSYRMSKFILILLTFAAVSIMINFNPTISRVLFGLPVLASCCLGILGSFYIYRGIGEPLTEKKVIAITVNLAMVILMLAILLSNTLYHIF
ncbi:hypothetical protein OZ410_10930 [Robiginitalea sp. M366]|uniref:hypothetical protein n=1 Tax=Robiginitalea aestuariiviva TaxID=3036903 RepID=UPI00240E847E|nr:hypothetical protein [Robiginitalea aestuariiviva]MDG1572829.1 hypothetical protein [Robiginitalea aestuariiviva]